jgi:HK97 family phage major capsid protein
MFVEKTQEEVDKMSATEYQTYCTQKSEHEANLRKEEIEKQIAEANKNNAKKEDVESLQNTLKEIIKEQELFGLRMKSVLEVKSSSFGIETVETKVNNWIQENESKIKEIHSAGSGHIEFEIKAVDAVSTASATLPSPAPALTGVQIAPPSNVNLRGSIVDGLINTIPTTQAVYAYTESLPKDGDYSFVAEKGTKPQIDLKFETRYAQPVKVAAHMVLTTESVQDIPNLRSIATNYLRAKHDLKRQNGILFGNGTAPNPKGATVYGRLFSAGALANSVVTPNFMDVVNACITDIYTTHNFVDEIPYMPSLVMISPNDFFINLVSAKDANGLPLYPSASLFNQVVIGGVTIIPFMDIPSGKIFVADMSKYNVTNYVSYTVKLGWINDQFITNQFTMVGESRFHAFVKKLDEQAFIYDDIATVKTAITAP